MIEELELFIIDLEYFAFANIEYFIFLEVLLLVLLGVYIYLNKTKKIDEKKVNKKLLVIIWGIVQVIALILIAVGVHEILTMPRWRVSHCSSAYGCVCNNEKTCDCLYTDNMGQPKEIVCPNNGTNLEG